MKKIKTAVLLIVALSFNGTLFAQSLNGIVLNYLDNKRTQDLNQYTSVFVSSPFNNTIIQNIHDDGDQVTYLNSDHFFLFNHVTNAYEELEQDIPTDVMSPGKGYVLQVGGNGTYTDVQILFVEQDFSGGIQNTGTITTDITANNFALLGNPYKDYLNLDAFLTHPSNVSKLSGTIYLWAHNTIVSQQI